MKSRIQFYPNDTLYNRLSKDATCAGVSISAFVVDIINEYYQKKDSSSQYVISFRDLKDKVFDEIQSYVSSHPVGDEFDILEASNTYRNIPMSIDEKPSTIRAQIGKIFSRQIGRSPFENIEYTGKVSSKNNKAAIYRKKEGAEWWNTKML